MFTFFWLFVAFFWLFVAFWILLIMSRSVVVFLLKMPSPLTSAEEMRWVSLFVAGVASVA